MSGRPSRRRRSVLGAASLLLSSWCTALSAAPPAIPRELVKGLTAGTSEARVDAVKAVAQRGGAEAVELLLGVAVVDREVWVRDNAVAALERLEDGAEQAALLDAGLRARDGGTRAVALEILAAQRAGGAGAAIADAMADRDPAVARAAIEAAGRVKAREAAGALIALVDGKTDAARAAAAVEALSRIGGDGIAARLEEWCASELDPAVRAQALDSLRFHDQDAAARHAALLLAELGAERGADDPARLALLRRAIAVAAAARRAAPLESLVRLLDHPRLAVRHRAWQALLALTGLEIPPEARAWQEWWDQYGATFEVPRDDPARARPAGGSVARFLGLPVFSDRVVFVLDFSGSMRDPGADGRPKSDTMREALREALEALPEGARFNVVTFADEARAWQKSLVEATPKRVEEAVAFLARAPPRGRTNLYDGALRALDEAGADTLVLLSDGAPSAGPFQFYSRVSRHLLQANRTRQMTISAVAIRPKDSARDFLERLCESTGGEFVARD